jgi:hypothetical protein
MTNYISHALLFSLLYTFFALHFKNDKHVIFGSLVLITVLHLNYSPPLILTIIGVGVWAIVGIIYAHFWWRVEYMSLKIEVLTSWSNFLEVRPRIAEKREDREKKYKNEIARYLIENTGEKRIFSEEDMRSRLEYVENEKRKQEDVIRIYYKPHGKFKVPSTVPYVEGDDTSSILQKFYPKFSEHIYPWL